VAASDAAWPEGGVGGVGGGQRQDRAVRLRGGAWREVERAATGWGKGADAPRAHA
jgi:hypothetical protein